MAGRVLVLALLVVAHAAEDLTKPIDAAGAEDGSCLLQNTRQRVVAKEGEFMEHELRSFGQYEEGHSPKNEEKVEKDGEKEEAEKKDGKRHEKQEEGKESLMHKEDHSRKKEEKHEKDGEKDEAEKKDGKRHRKEEEEGEEGEKESLMHKASSPWLSSEDARAIGHTYQRVHKLLDRHGKLSLLSEKVTSGEQATRPWREAKRALFQSIKKLRAESESLMGLGSARKTEAQAYIKELPDHVGELEASLGRLEAMLQM